MNEQVYIIILESCISFFKISDEFILIIHRTLFYYFYELIIELTRCLFVSAKKRVRICAEEDSEDRPYGGR